MATHPIVLKKRRRVIEALEAGVAQTHVAEREGLSRKTVRKWKRLWEEHGEQWLHDRLPRRRPVMPNQTPLEVELAIVDYALAHPEQGPKTIAAVLRPKYGVGVTAVYGSLKRRGLETRTKRLECVFRRNRSRGPGEAGHPFRVMPVARFGSGRSRRAGCSVTRVVEQHWYSVS